MATAKPHAYPQRYKIDVISDEQVKAVHQASLDVLERVGCTTSNDMLLKVLADHGQRVDFEEKRFFLDPAYVEKMVAQIPRNFTMGARNPENALKVTGEYSWVSTDGCPAQIIDLDTKDRRYSNKQDMSDVAKVADALPQVGILWQSVSANDEIVPVRPMHETHAMFPSTSKHIMQMTACDEFNARGLIEMGTAIAGSAESLRENPIFSNFQCVISPFHWDGDPVDAMKLFAEHGIPIGICSMPMMAATAPASVAGLVTLANAEILSGFTIMQTLVPGSPNFYISYASDLDMNSGAMNPAWGPEGLFAECAASAMARFYDVASVKSTMGTGSLQSDWTAGVQNSFSAMSSLLVGGDFFTGIGSLHSDSIYSLMGLVLDSEIMEIMFEWANGYAFDEEALAVGTIEHVGPGGHFLGEDHTLTHMRDFFRSRVMNRQTWEDWDAAGRPDPRIAAEAEVRRILSEHEPDPLPEDLEKELDKIMETYEAEARENEDDD